MRFRFWLLAVAVTLVATLDAWPSAEGSATAGVLPGGHGPWLPPLPQRAQSGVLYPDPVVHASTTPLPQDSGGSSARSMPADAGTRRMVPMRPRLHGAMSSAADVVVPDVSPKLGAPLPDPDHNPTPPPGDPRRLSLFRNTTVPVPSTITPAVQEPSTGQWGKNIFSTGNGVSGGNQAPHAEFSRDNGNTWRLLPSNLFAPYSCCDQVAVYDRGFNRQYWVTQYNPFNFTGVPGNGHLVLANSPGGNFVNWCPYSIAPTTFGRSSEEDFDFNDVVVGNRYLYLTTRAIKFDLTAPNGEYFVHAVMLLRVSRSDLAACRPAHYDVIFRADITDDLRVPQGITNIAYAGAVSVPEGQGRGRVLRLLVWPEISKVVATVDLRVPAFRYMTDESPKMEGNCASQDGMVINWCGEDTSSELLTAARGGGYLWFGWAAQQYGSKRPFPYTRITKIRERDLRVDGSHDLYGLTVAHVFTQIAPDARGNIGLVDAFGGGIGGQHYFPSSMIGIFDGISPVSPSVDFFLRGQGNGCIVPTTEPLEVYVGNWGDYLTIRGLRMVDGVWNASTYVRNDDNPIGCDQSVGASLTIKNIDFGRERDRINYIRWIHSATPESRSPGVPESRSPGVPESRSPGVQASDRHC